MPMYGMQGLTKKQQELIWGKTESRQPLKASVKTQVYKRAKGKCESCGEKTAKSLGAFHHWRDPKISPTAKTVQFLCLKCHKKYGHKIKVVTHSDPIRGTWKETKIVRVKVRKHPKRKPKKKKSTHKKRKTKKKTPKKKTTRKKKTRKKRKRKTKSPFNITMPTIELPKL
jgi:hypothetical protein